MSCRIADYVTGSMSDTRALATQKSAYEELCKYETALELELDDIVIALSHAITERTRKTHQLQTAIETVHELEHMAKDLEGHGMIDGNFAMEEDLRKVQMLLPLFQDAHVHQADCEEDVAALDATIALLDNKYAHALKESKCVEQDLQATYLVISQMSLVCGEAALELVNQQIKSYSIPFDVNIFTTALPIAEFTSHETDCNFAALANDKRITVLAATEHAKQQTDFISESLAIEDCTMALSTTGPTTKELNGEYHPAQLQTGNRPDKIVTKSSSEQTDSNSSTLANYHVYEFQMTGSNSNEPIEEGHLDPLQMRDETYKIFADRKTLSQGNCQPEMMIKIAALEQELQQTKEAYHTWGAKISEIEQVIKEISDSRAQSSQSGTSPHCSVALEPKDTEQVQLDPSSMCPMSSVSISHSSAQGSIVIGLAKQDSSSARSLANASSQEVCLKAHKVPRQLQLDSSSSRLASSTSTLDSSVQGPKIARLFRGIPSSNSSNTSSCESSHEGYKMSKPVQRDLPLCSNCSLPIRRSKAPVQALSAVNIAKAQKCQIHARFGRESTASSFIFRGPRAIGLKKHGFTISRAPRTLDWTKL